MAVRLVQFSSATERARLTALLLVALIKQAASASVLLIQTVQTSTAPALGLGQVTVQPTVTVLLGSFATLLISVRLSAKLSASPSASGDLLGAPMEELSTSSRLRRE